MSRIFSRVPAALAIAASFLGLLGCNKLPAAAHGKVEPPVQVEQVQNEDSINTIKLSPQAEQRLGMGGEVIEPPGGTAIVSAPLGEVAEIAIVPAANEIKRENTSRRIDVLCNVRDRDLGSVAIDIEDRVRQLPFELGYHPAVLGEYAAQRTSRRQMLNASLAALAAVLVLIDSEFRAWRLVLLVMVGLLFAFQGGVLGAWLGGGNVSLGSLVGFVTVVGIAVRNGIMLISHYQHLLRHEGVEFGDELAIRGAEERLAPILMTALTTALALAPLVIAGQQPGNEIEYPMALVILGGLIAATTMNLFCLPALYRRFGR